MQTNSEDNAKTSISERIKERSYNLSVISEQNKAKKEDNLSATENTNYFMDRFSQMKNDIKIKLDDTHSIDKNRINEYLNNLVEDVNSMQHFLNESSMFLASFTIKKAQESIDDINEKVQNCIQEFQPKKRFGFRNRNDKIKSNNKVVTSSEFPIEVTNHHTEIYKDSNFFGFKNCVGETLTKSPEEMSQRQLNLCELINCKVIALGNPSSLQFSSLKDTLVLVGPTSRSALIKDCVNCTFVLACQQVRIHNSENTDFYLHVTGAAIIENCKNLNFGPYTLEYENLGQDFEISGLSKERNNWKEVQDFYWFNNMEKSPNFKLLNESEWKRNWL